MIDQLKATAIFVMVVDKKSFKAAAVELGLTPSVVSHHISKLEAKLGLVLLYRSTRKLSLTHDGKILYEAAKNMMQQVEAGLDKINHNDGDLRGSLKLTMPATFTCHPILKKIAEFLILYPKVQADIRFTDLHESIIGQGIDLAIRVGNLPNSDLKVKKIDQVELCLVASAGYIASMALDLAEINHPNDLAHWDFIGIAQRPMNKVLSPIIAAKNAQSVKIEYASRTIVDDATAAMQLACQGLGVASPPYFLLEDRLQSGELVHLLPDWLLPPMPIYAVWPANSPKNSLTKRLVEFLVK